MRLVRLKPQGPGPRSGPGPPGITKNFHHFGPRNVYLCMPVTNCSGDRSFSVLSPVKNEIRTTVSDERLNAVCLMAVESSLVRSLDFEAVIN